MLRKLSLVTGLLVWCASAQATIDISKVPLFVSDAVPPLNMLVMGRDHKLYYEAYNDASDLNGDGVIDVGYKGYLPEDQGGIDYFGYFNSYVCYDYSSGGTFVPAVATADKTCAGKWSGDYLNYLTTARIDALRKVLYGGYRVTDTTAETVLQGSFIPQDAHTWGKEYASVAHDGFSISDYTPLSQPAAGSKHLFAVVSLTNGGVPQLRTLTNTDFRIWNWVSKERPVAGDKCVNSSGNNVDCVPANSSSNWEKIPDDRVSNLELRAWNLDSSTSAAGDLAAMNQLFSGGASCTTRNVISLSLDFGQGRPSLNNSCNVDNFRTRVIGTLTPPVTGDYEFSIDGDDAVDLYIGVSDAREPLSHWYGAHGAAGNATDGRITRFSKYLFAGQSYEVRVRHQEVGGGRHLRFTGKSPPVPRLR